MEEITSMHVSMGLCCFAIGMLVGFWMILHMLGDEGAKQRGDFVNAKSKMESEISSLKLKLRLEETSNSSKDKRISELENRIGDVLDILDPNDPDGDEE